MRCDLNKIILLGAHPGDQLEIHTGLLRAGMRYDRFHIDKEKSSTLPSRPNDWIYTCMKGLITPIP